ncbi:hypothetical protein PR202_ga23954 [Eleusine coracana subsp. coracana]|uniref:Uncharacterized protein n=1 Tax=Eleusine coracana subsp. coracana TaxID=191504 RepID=A0AAV5D7M8_ELECO|nr:hypothetical protein PR202_ga23954 [Eleusine coracana subsp. coracana]
MISLTADNLNTNNRSSVQSGSPDGRQLSRMTLDKMTIMGIGRVQLDDHLPFTAVDVRDPRFTDVKSFLAVRTLGLVSSSPAASCSARTEVKRKSTTHNFLNLQESGNRRMAAALLHFVNVSRATAVRGDAASPLRGVQGDKSRSLWPFGVRICGSCTHGG